MSSTKDSIGSLFDRIAHSYDALNHLFSLNIDKLWRRKTVSTMSSCDVVLDVAIGTADLSLEMIRQDKAQVITGIDLSREMMAIGEKKVKAKLGKAAERVSFVYANAQDMPFDDESFDAVTCGFGVRNFADLDKGLSEMYRVLKRNGELRILEFSYPSNRLIRRLYDFYFSRVMPLAGRLFSRDKTAYTYLNRSVKNFIWGEQMQQKLTDIGFDNVEYKELTFGIATLYSATK